jgi:SAM-dependent methyltransferase
MMSPRSRASLASVAIIVAASALFGTVAGGRKPVRRPDIHYVPTPHEVVAKMLELAAVGERDVVYDLGCGDGRIVIAAAKKYGARGVGYDIDPRRVAEARANAKAAGVAHLVSIEEADIFTLDLSGASVITLYLFPDLNVRLIPQLEKLAPGSRIVSHDFDMKGVSPDVYLEMDAPDVSGNGMRLHRIYGWTAPIRVTPDAPSPVEP